MRGKAAGRNARPVAGDTPRARRATQQRERILDAAERCFIQSGFHAASMAQIAAEADISAGLIYRYFPSKSGLVLAIIQRHVETEGCTIVDALNTVEDVCAAMLDTFERWRRRTDPKMNAALFLELSAESTRDQQIETAVRAKDQTIRPRLVQLLRRMAQARGVDLAATEAQSRALMLQCLIEGLAVRAVHDTRLQRSKLAQLLQRQLLALITP